MIGVLLFYVLPLIIFLGLFALLAHLKGTVTIGEGLLAAMGLVPVLNIIGVVVLITAVVSCKEADVPIWTAPKKESK